MSGKRGSRGAYEVGAARALDDTLIVQDLDGNERSLRSIVGRKKTLLIFVRHFG
jgi:hypothetical protein